MIAAKAHLTQQLASLFRETGSAHHKAFIATSGDDPEWPIWYAEFLQPKLNALLSAQWTKSEIVYLLLRAEKELSGVTPNPSWPEFYAGVLIEEGQVSPKV